MIWLLDTSALIKCKKFTRTDVFKKKYTYITIFSLIEYPIAAQYKELTVFFPSPLSFTNSLEYVLKLRIQGTPISTIDILNGAIAVEKKATLVTEDAHFKVLNSIVPSLNVISTEDYLIEIQKV